MSEIKTIKFHNQDIVVASQNGIDYVSAKHICDNLGIDWGSQHRKITKDDVLKSSIVIMTIEGEHGKSREMLMIPVEYLNGWLFTISPNKVNPEIKEKIIEYKKECYKVLNDYFKHGVAVNDNFKDTQKQIDILSEKLSILEKEYNRQAIDLLETKSQLETKEGELFRINDVLTPKMKNHVKQMVKNKVKKEPMLTFQGVYSKLNEKFQVAEYKEIRRKDYYDVCEFFDESPLPEYRQHSQQDLLSQLPKWLRCKIVPSNDLILVYGDRAYRIDEAVRPHINF
ncbi:phage antirepressor N-terminal domain-containing protein [Francisella philomiragia]|uniref:Phage antirepressor N-terminal domain-containing protein n=1 Tax=Francisella philomiragia TaxID=28110 RepID=A0ABS1GD32_9GAMM|nr:phage antirepressor N-terminal domain-containing protein [Francisella philomiragia]MBK2258981.1 phage antirepressor N-terminal domain-containing protein [Francisella philomiragia]MBK2302672.1 phage antirepressor N-terminal domain-containing protein [Francisella philomiragia]